MTIFSAFVWSQAPAETSQHPGVRIKPEARLYGILPGSMFPSVQTRPPDADPGDDGTSTVHQLQFSDSESSEDEDANTNGHPGDYSTRMEELMGDEEVDTQESEEDEKAEDEEQEDKKEEVALEFC